MQHSGHLINQQFKCSIQNYAYVGWNYFMSNLEITCHWKEHTSRAADCLSSTATALPSNSNNNNMQCDYASVFFSTPVWCLLSQSCQGWSAGGEMDELPSRTLEESIGMGKTENLAPPSEGLAGNLNLYFLRRAT